MNMNVLNRYLPFITLSRTLNLIKLFFSFWLSRLIRKPVHWGMPFALSVEPGTACDLRCPQCPTGNGTLNRPGGRMQVEDFETLLDMLPGLTVVNLYLQGEPFLHPRMTDMIRIASEKKLYTITSTNGQHISEETAAAVVNSGLSEIWISMDGVTQDSYAKYRKGGDLEKVKRSIKLLSDAKKRSGKILPCIVVQFIVFRHNENEVEEFKRMAGKLGADRAEIKTAQFYELGEGGVEPPVSEKFRRYASRDELKLKGKTRNHCWKSWMSAVVTWNGEVLPCCYDKDGEHSLGNIRNAEFYKVWNGDKAMKFRKAVLTNKEKIEMCRNCPEGRSFFT